jgi:prepilin signal peptidase PulO-like enzyme (type II secretory pathway)
MTLLCAFGGLLVGSLINWAGDYLPRFSSSSAASPYKPTSRPRSALWHLLTSFISQRNSFHLQRSSWLGVGVELFTGLLFAYLCERFGPSWRLLLPALVGSFFLLIAIIDLKYRLVLNVLIYPAAAVTLLLHSVPPGRDTLTALLGGAIGLSPFLLVALVRPGDMGGGDVKLAALIGLMVGFPQVLWPISLGILAGGITALSLLITHRWGPRSHIPYAPFLCLGAMLSFVYTPLPPAFLL